MSCFRFYDANFADVDILANYDVSSELAGYPVLNAFNGKRRAKVWRSAGLYEVTASNQDIIFRESVGVDLTATLTIGEYQRAAFLTEIKTALEAVGASTYTVTFESSLKIKIASNLAGGGGVFQLRGADAGFTALDLLGFNNVTYSGASNYTADSIRIMSSEWIEFDLGIASNPTAFFLIDARNEPIKISPTATIKLQANHTNNWTSPVLDLTLTYDDRIIHSIDDDGLASAACRYWRIQLIDQNPLGYIQVGAFFLGSSYETVQGAPQFPFRAAQIDRTETVYSEGGQTFSEIKPKTERFLLDWFGLTIDEKEEIERIYELFGLGIPFFISMDTEIAFSSSQQYYIRYVKFSNQPTYELTRPQIWKMTLEFEEQL